MQIENYLSCRRSGSKLPARWLVWQYLQRPETHWGHWQSLPL
jgi:hypothetical protein